MYACMQFKLDVEEADQVLFVFCGLT